MASSRWKRFAFFERHTLTLPSDVLEDLIPLEGNSSRASNRLSLHALNQAAQESSDAVGLVVTTAALPLTSKPKNEAKPTKEKDSLAGMWSSLSACTAPDLTEDDAPVQLPSQAEILATDDAETTVSSAVDGLVLVFVTSHSTDFVHCFDVTVRCNPPDTDADLEDLDGWRGYISPFAEASKASSTSSLTTSRTIEDRIINDHLEEAKPEGVVAIAVCRSTKGHRAVQLACLSTSQVIVWEDPHLYLSCRRPLTNPYPVSAKKHTLASPWNTAKDGLATAVDVAPGLVAVGMNSGAVFVYEYGNNRQGLRSYCTIPPPPASGLEVVAVKLSFASDKASVFVAYHKVTDATSPRSSAGICCYDMPLPGPNSNAVSAPSSRHDLDGRQVASINLCDASPARNGVHFTVARPDGLYTYSQTQKVGVAPIDGTKLAICIVPPPIRAANAREVTEDVASGYALVASTDSKSGRDAVDIYDATNKLVAFHLLLSPGHCAVGAAGVTTMPSRSPTGTSRGGRSSAVVLTSGGQIVTLTEKVTSEKVSLLVQKNLYSAAIIVAYSDPSYEAAEITALYRRHAEHLYRKGEYSAAMDQYIHTIGSLESSHIIFRYLDAPKIPLLVKYLEQLRAREQATPVHNELLRTCYLKLNDTESAEAIVTSASKSMDSESLSSIVSTLANNPKDALAKICSLSPPQAAEALVVHGASLARALPRETAGVVISLCLGTYSPAGLADAAVSPATEANKLLEYGGGVVGEHQKACDPYPVHIFASAFLENPKMLRLLLAHCNRNKCPLTPSLRRTLLELTLAEWNQAKRSGDTEAEKLRRKEAIAALTDSHCRDIGDYDALVIVQLAGFDEGELLLYERLQMGPMLLARYANDGSEKARRQMLAMCQRDPEVLADVLGHFVSIASSKMNEDKSFGVDDGSEDEMNEILDDIQEALELARRQGVLPPVRIARILAGEGTGQFGTQGPTGKTGSQKQKRTVPLAVALDYVGAILDESRKEISRLRSEVEEYNQLCNSMEAEVDSLLRTSLALPASSKDSTEEEVPPRLNIEEMYAKVRLSMEEGDKASSRTDDSREAFWREMNQSEDTFETIARFFAKSVIH